MFTSLMVLMPEARLPAQPGRHWAMVLVISNRSDQSAASRGLDEGEGAFFSHYDPETVEFLPGLGR